MFHFFIQKSDTLLCWICLMLIYHCLLLCLLLCFHLFFSCNFYSVSLSASCCAFYFIFTYSSLVIFIQSASFIISTTCLVVLVKSSKNIQRNFTWSKNYLTPIFLVGKLSLWMASNPTRSILIPSCETIWSSIFPSIT